MFARQSLSKQTFDTKFPKAFMRSYHKNCIIVCITTISIRIRKEIAAVITVAAAAAAAAAAYSMTSRAAAAAAAAHIHTHTQTHKHTQTQTHTHDDNLSRKLDVSSISQFWMCQIARMRSVNHYNDLPTDNSKLIICTRDG